jgi:hypothetical protein
MTYQEIRESVRQANRRQFDAESEARRVRDAEVAAIQERCAAIGHLPDPCGSRSEPAKGPSGERISLVSHKFRCLVCEAEYYGDPFATMLPDRLKA